ncbi:MAG: hypothetical protein ABIR47_11320 [Candidatus Kapaibacterium sp.]
MNETLELDDQDDVEDLNNDDPNALPDHTRTKWIILGSLVGLAAIMPIVENLVPLIWKGVVVILHSILNQALAYTWVYFDSVEFGDPIGFGMRVLVILFGPFVIPFYLFHSRGAKYGMRAIGKMLIVFFAMTGAYAAVNLWIKGESIF